MVERREAPLQYDTVITAAPVEMPQKNVGGIMQKRQVRSALKLLLCLAALALSGCGGGGGGGGSGGAMGTGSTGSSYPLTLSTAPASLTATLVQGAAGLFTLQAHVTGTVSTTSTFYVVIDDTSGVFQPTKIYIGEMDSASAPTPYSDWLAELVTSTTLPVSEEKGTLNVRVCSDLSCTTVYGQTGIPYDFTVDADSNITTIAALPGALDWRTGGGDASRMSYVPITLDPSSFTVRWLQTDMEQLEPAGDVAGGSLLVTDSTDRLVAMMVPATEDASSPAVAAYGGLVTYSEIDGTPAWHENLMDSGGTQQEPGPPTISNGIIYTTQGPDIDNGGYSGDVSFTGLSARTGAVAFSTQIPDTFNQNYGVEGEGCGPGSPVVSGGVAFVNPGCISDGPFGSNPPMAIAAFDATSGQSLWTGSTAGGKKGTNVASDGNDLYYIVPLDTTQPTLTALSQANGAAQWQTTLAGDGAKYYHTPVLDGSGGAVVVTDTPGGAQISRYALVSGQLTWQITVSSIATVQAMAVANGTIYVGYDGTILALNLADGSTAWSWSAASYDKTTLNGLVVGTNVDSVIVTNGLLFVGTDRDMYAVDLSTHQTVWSLALPGYQMAISPSGMLYVVTSLDSNVSSSGGGSYIPSNQALMSVNLH